MERKTIVAIVLSLAVMVGWNGWYYWRYKGVIETNLHKKQMEKKDGVKPETASASPSATAPSGDSKPLDLSVGADARAAAEIRKILVNTGVAEMTLSTAGGTISSLRLFHYKDGSGNPTELINPKSLIRPLSLAFATPDASKKINDSIFTADATGNITLTPGNPVASVLFSLRLENGVSITKKLTLHYGSYLADLDVGVDIPSADVTGSAYGLVWGGLGGEEGQNSYIGPVILVDGKRLADEPKDKEPKDYEGQILWGGLTNKYYCATFIPGPRKSRITTSRMDDKSYAVSLQLPANNVNRLSLYVGPKDHTELKKVGNEMMRMINYGWFDILANPLFLLLTLFNSFIGNFGISIILLTVLVKLLFWPLSQSSFKSMEKMKKVQPQMKMIQERYKNDKAKLNEELIALYRKHKINPMAGCLPIVLQIPVFVALYKVLLESIDLKGAPFLLWITDLSAKDPYYVTPILMGLSMLAQQKMSPATGDPMQRKIMMFMPAIFTFMFINFPSGLVIYWLVNNLLSILQQYTIQMRNKQEV